MDRDDERLHEQGDDQERRKRWRTIGVRVFLALALIGIGLAGGVIWAERRASSGAGAKANPAASRTAETKTPSAQGGSMPSMPGMAGGGQAGQPSGARVDEAVEVSLTPEAIERAGIKTAEVKSQVTTATVTIPATVMSNAYRDTKVNAVVGGIVRQVSVELGSEVQRGQPLAVIFSSELADAQMKYLSMRAMLQADNQKLQRTQKLVELGAASRQELEEVTATQAARETEVAAARQRLLLLGLAAERVAKLDHASQVVSEVTVPAPANGIVITRTVNPGQVVGAGHELFVVTDLSSVWVIADLYEKDFPGVRVGTPATVAIPSVPERPLRGRVAYIDPRVDPATRTAKVRIEVPNREGQLRLGMFVQVSLEGGTGERRVLVPKSAVQSVGDRTVVYVPTEDEGRFAERPIKVGAAVGDALQVLDGLKPGERVVTEGSFFLRAEAGRSRAGG